MNDFVNNGWDSNNYQNPNEFYGNVMGSRMNNVSKLNNGYIWYTCCLPALGLFLENYAISKWAGIFLWAGVIVMMIFCCFLDFKQVKKLVENSQGGYSLGRLKKWIIFPPMYIYVRQKYCMMSSGVMMTMIIVFSFSAIFSNGFFQGLSVTESSMPELLQNSYVQSLDNFSGYSNNMIGEQIQYYLGNSAVWDCTKEKDVFTVMCSGRHENQRVEIYFLVEFDGFSYQAVEVADISIDGKTLEGEEFTEKMDEIFISLTEDNAFSDDSSLNKNLETA